LDGIFTNGVSSVKNSIINGNGGKGIYNLGTIEIASTIVNNNINTGIDNSGKATLTDSFVTGNASGGISNFGEIDISNSVISNNTALQLTLQVGGGIRNSGKLNLSKSTVASNTAILGGGIYNSGVVNSSNSVISNNKAADGSGGGIYNSVFINSGVVNLSNDTITGNYAGNFGGGIYNSGTLNSSANISGNTAGKVWYRSPEGIIRDSINPEYIIDPQYPNVYDKGKLVASPPTSPPTPEPSKPVVSVSAWVEIPAGDNQEKTLEFTVTLSSASDKPIILDYYLLDGSANSLEKKNEQDKNHKQDFVGLSIADPLSIDLKQIKQTLVFFPGEDIKKIKVPVLPKTPNTVIDKTFEIFARDTAYRPWTNADKGKEVDQVYDYDDLGYEGYRINKVIENKEGLEAIGLTSDEDLFLVLANPINGTVEPSNSDLLSEIASSTGGNDNRAYQVGQEVINQLNSANQTYTFVKGVIFDQNKPPVLALRGTEFSKVTTDVLTGTNSEGVGYNQFIGSQSDINQWLTEVSNPVSGVTFRPHLTGHSLGGALSQWVGSTYQGKLGKIVTFNSPGISQQAGINLNPANNLGVKHYVTSGDVVSMLGSTYLQGVWDLNKYSKLSSAITFEKHSVPVTKDNDKILSKILRTGLTRPVDLTTKIANGNTTDLSSPKFTFLPDSDYFALQVTVAGLRTIFGSVQSGVRLAAALTFRESVEAKRQAIGKAISVITSISNTATLAYNASLAYTSAAWNSIIQQSEKKLEELFPANLLKPESASILSSNLPIPTTDNIQPVANSLNIEKNTLLKSNLPIQTADIIQPDLPLSSQTTGSEEINNFWDVVPSWSAAAWQATTRWSDTAWTSINEWQPETWAATINWTDNDWNTPFFTISNPSIIEGDSGTKQIVFDVTLSVPSSQTITVNYSTQDNTAISGSDYTSTSGTLTFAPNETIKNISVSILSDSIAEENETFFINLNNPISAILTDSQGQGTITDNDSPAINNLAPSTINFLNPILGLAENTIIGTGIKVAELEIIDDGLGTNILGLTGTDATSFTIQGTELFYIGPSPDFEVKNQYQVTVTVDDPTVGNTPDASANFTLTIIDVNENINQAPFVQIFLDDQTVPTEDNAGGKAFIFNVTRSGDTTGSTTVNWGVTGGAVSPANGADFVGGLLPTGTLSFAAGEIEKVIIVNVQSDTFVETDEIFNVVLSNPTNNAFLTSAQGKILNDDTFLDDLTTPMFRLRNNLIPGTYLFVGQEEAQSIANSPIFSSRFTNEGFAFAVASSPTDPLLQPFYRFANTAPGREGTYLFVGEDEKNFIVQNIPSFRLDGVAFHALSAGAGNSSINFSRFQNLTVPGTYLFTGPSETASVMGNPNFILEGLAFAAGG